MVTKTTEIATEKDLLSAPSVPNGHEHEHEESDDNDEEVQDAEGSFISWISISFTR
jgi:hypothetical protein